MRQASIDGLRTLAIILMVVVHFIENLSGGEFEPGGLGAPLFAFLAGVSFRLWRLSREAKAIPEEVLFKVAVRRGLFLFCLGIVFNVLVWLPEDTFNWDVLTMIGTGLILLAFTKDLPNGFLSFLCIVMAILSPFLRLKVDYDTNWSIGHFESNRTLASVLIGYLATGYFPLFPWLVFPIVGYMAGRTIYPDSIEGEEYQTPSVRPVILYGILLMVLSALMLQFGPQFPEPVPDSLLIGWEMFPASVEYVTGMLGMSLFLFGVLHVVVDRRGWLNRFPSVLSAVRIMSQYSLSIYFLHHIVHIWPLWLVATLSGVETTAYWRTALPYWWAMLLAVVFLLGSYLLFRRMANRDWPGLESLMRWLCD